MGCGRQVPVAHCMTSANLAIKLLALEEAIQKRWRCHHTDDSLAHGDHSEHPGSSPLARQQDQSRPSKLEFAESLLIFFKVSLDCMFIHKNLQKCQVEKMQRICENSRNVSTTSFIQFIEFILPAPERDHRDPNRAAPRSPRSRWLGVTPVTSGTNVTRKTQT